MPVAGVAKVYHLSGFAPAGTVKPGVPVTVSFTVAQPSGAPLVHYRTGPGPHVGVHLIIVRDDLATIIHRHPPIGKNGLIQQRWSFSKPGPYHVLVDLYPATPGPGYVNFQLFKTIHVAGAYHPQPLPPYRPEVTVGGWRFTIKRLPVLRLGPGRADHRDREQRRRTAGRVPALVRRDGARDLLPRRRTWPTSTRTSAHQTRPAARAVSGATAIAGSSTTPGVMHVGVLAPETGTWRLFLQCKIPATS